MYREESRRKLYIIIAVVAAAVVIVIAIAYNPVMFNVHLGRLANENPEVRERAVKALASYGESYDQALLDALKKAAQAPEEPSNRRTIDGLFEVLELKGKLTLDVKTARLSLEPELQLIYCLSKLRDGKTEVAAAAARLLGSLRDVRATEGLVKLLGNTVVDYPARLQAARALVKIKDPKGIPGLAAVLKREPPELEPIRLAVVTALGKTGSPDAFDAIAGALRRDGSAKIRRAATLAIGRLGVPKGVRELKNVTKYERDTSVITAAYMGLGYLHHQDSFKFLANALEFEENRGNKEMVAYILTALYRLDPSNLPYVNAVSDYLKEAPSDENRLDAALALFENNNPTAFGVILEALGSTRLSRREHAAGALSLVPDAPVFEYDLPDQMERRKQYETLESWWKKAGDRLAWDAKDRLYRLPE